MKIFKNLFLFLFFVFTCSCNENIYEEQEEAWIGIVLPGKSIDGIKLGDSRDDVIGKLGQPNSGGMADGTFRSWYGADYSEGAHAGLSVYYIELQDGSHGPADIIAAGGLYKGKTKEGIGIGTALKDVRRYYGNPDKMLSGEIENPARTTNMDIYCMSGKKFEIHYEDSLVTGFSLGYFLPPLMNLMIVNKKGFLALQNYFC